MLCDKLSFKEEGDVHNIIRLSPTRRSSGQAAKLEISSNHDIDEKERTKRLVQERQFQPEILAKN